MNKSVIIKLATLLLVCNSALVNTATVSDPVKQITGKVRSVSLADPKRETRSEIVVVDKNKKVVSVIVKDTTTIYDMHWKPINLERITRDQVVRIKYTTSQEGLDRAKSISLEN